MSVESEKRNLGLKVAVPVIIGVGVVVALFYKEFNPEALREIRFTSRAWTGILLALAAVVMRDFGMAWRFRSLTDRHLGWGAATNVTLLCEFTSAITPTSVGGSALSMFFLKKEGVPMGKATTLTVTTLFLDELFFVLIVPSVFLLLPKNMLFGFDATYGSGIRIAFWIAYGAIAVWTLLLFLGLVVFPGGIKKLIKGLFGFKLLRRWRSSAGEFAGNMYAASVELRSKRMQWWGTAFLATVVSWCGRYLVVNALFFGFIPDASQLLVFCRQIVVWALLMFSPTPGGSGLSEWLFKEYYGDMISGAGVVMILAVLWRILTYYIYLFIGIFLLPRFFRKK